jgi:hypothetical protein
MTRLVSVLIVIALPATAHAEKWAYDWRCSGRCAGGVEHTISGSQDFETEAACNAARDADWRISEFNEEGNYGNVDYCYRTDGDGGSDAGAPRKPLGLAKLKVGAVAGGGFTATHPDRSRTVGGKTFGMELDVHFGNPKLGFEGSAGIWWAHPQSPVFGDSTKHTIVVPLAAGFVSSPVALYRGKKVEVRPDLGMSFGFLYTGTCSYCGPAGSTNLGFRGRLGLDVYIGPALGFSLDFIVPIIGTGSVDDDVDPTAVELLAPRYMVRIGMVARNLNLAGW